MKLKFLLLLMMVSGILYSQEPYRNLIISEARMEHQRNNHVELTNMGDKDINLSEFKFVLMRPWIPQPILDVWNDPWVPEGNRMFMLPDKILKPGESFVMTTALDFEPRQYYNRIADYEGAQRPKQIDIYDLADFLIHIAEPNGIRNVNDSVTVSDRYGDNYQRVFETWGGRGCFMIEHHFAEGDSAVVDQVGGVFDNNGKNFAHAYDVAGVTGATGNSLLVRKHSIKTGNLDFANARGVGLEDSEWMPITRPAGYNVWRDLWWTVGNNGPYVLDENTLESDAIEVDFANKKLTVPWGVRRLDDIMRHMKKKPGIAWNYHLNPNREDSLYYSTRTGDKLTIYVVGNTLHTEDFDIEVLEPTADANILVPKARVNIGSVRSGGAIRTNTQAGIDGIDWPRVTRHDHGKDTITGTWHGLPHAMRTDTLMKYLEKPDNAKWEFVFLFGVTRPDLKDGDKLKVTSANGKVKEYYLQVQPYGPGHNANLSAITWPDMPANYKDLFKVYGWQRDTIPNFSMSSFNYRVNIPVGIENIPALIPKTEDLNATVEVIRATSFSAGVDERTMKFIVTAEDGIVKTTYTVEFVKEQDPENMQPYKAEPFLSEYVFQEQFWNHFGEICNPGNVPIDLSDYMIAMLPNVNPSEVIKSRMEEDDWLNRYDKYIPGYKWVSEAQWSITPGIVVQDLSVNSIVQPGDVFCYGHIVNDGSVPNRPYVWPVPGELDVMFGNFESSKGSYKNPWGENMSGDAFRRWKNSSWYMFKILNDSIKLGLKPANDPYDFELIEVFSMAATTDWIIGGGNVSQMTNFIRKPDIYKGNTGFGENGSFGTNPDDTEWTWTNQAYWNARGVRGPWDRMYQAFDIGKHFMNEPTHYKSTVSSAFYKVSKGYSMEENIRGMTPGTTVENFLNNIIKANDGQTLKVMSGDAQLGMDDLISLNDYLIVLSADSTNTSQYILDVSEEGLSPNALISSDLYDVGLESQSQNASLTAEAGIGYITGFEYGTLLETVLNSVSLPEGATLTIIDDKGAYVPLMRLNFDTTYVNVTVNSNTYFEVVAEDNVTRIIYQLRPVSTVNDAFIVSDVYTVNQSENLVNFIPRGTNVHIFLSNIAPTLGASVKVVDKMGVERTEGTLYEDDKVVVTSPNGLFTRVYHLSMLRTQFILGTTYLAYVLSDTYAVDQVDYIIQGATTSTDVSDFYSHIRPSMGATAVVVDANGDKKSYGDLALGDRLKVTSADGKIEVLYELKLNVVSINLPETAQIEIYPNPTTGKLNISGLEQGNRIKLFNVNGILLRDIKAQNNIETLTLEDQPAGIYLIVISKNDQLIGRFKAIRK